MFSIRLGHRLGPRLGAEDSLVAISLQLGKEKLVELVRLNLEVEVVVSGSSRPYLLHRDDVCSIVSHLVQDSLLPANPRR